MKTKNGLKNRISIAAIAFAVLLAFLFAGTVLFAYFSADKIIDGDISSVPELSVDISTSADSGAATVFKKAGDKFTASVTVTNQNDFAVSYGFKLTGIENAALRDALILSLDGKTLGTLSKCTDSDGNFKLSEEFLLAPSDMGGVAVKESRSHSLSLELHLGAGNLFSEVVNRVNLFVTAKSFVDHNYLFVTSAEEFLQAIRPETLSGSVVKTVYLAKNVDLSAYNENTNTAEAVGGAPARTASDVVISQPVRIELNGKTLKLNTGLFLTNQNEMPSAITSAFSGGTVAFAADNANGLVVDMPNSYVSFGANGAFAENLSVGSVVFASIDEQKLADAAAKYAAAAMKEGLTSEPMDILGGFGYYASSEANRLTVSVAPMGLTEISQTGNVCKLKVADEAFGFLPENFMVSVSFAVGGTTSATAKASAKLLSNESLTDAILREFNAYFYTEDAENPGTYTINSVTDVRRDLYLPTRVRSFNATVEWFSSDEASFSKTGKYRPAMDDQTVTLTAVVSFEGVRTKREFILNVLAFSAAERLKLMLAEETVVFTKSPDSRVLSFDAAKYKLENLTYRIADADTNYLELKKEAVDNVESDVLHLKSSPSDSWTTGITVTANAAGGDTVSATLKVTVKIERSVSIIDEANRYAQTYLPVGNTFLSFPVPSEYNELVTLEYSLPSGEFTVGGNRYANAANVGNYIAVSALDKENKRYTVKIDATKVPTENSTVYLRVKFIYGDEIDERVLSFELSGILHHNDDEISDFSLYIKLLNAVDANGDLWLTRDEADAANVSELKINNAGITSLKGIEYFRLTGTLDLAYNKLSDIDALSGMYDLKTLNLSYNLLSSVTALKNCTSLTRLNLSNNLNLSDVSPLSGLTDVTELLLHSDSSQSALSDISCIRNMKDLKTLRVYNTGVSSVMENNRNAILTAYFHYFDNHGTAPDYYITGNNTKFTLSASTVDKYRAANDAINDLVPIYEFSNVIYLPPTVNGYDVTWNWYPSDVLEKTDDNRFIVHEPLADINAVLSATVPIGVNSERILRSFSVVSRGDNAAHGIQTTEGGSYLAAESIIPDSNLRYLLFKEFDTDGNKMISYSELIRKVDSALSFNNQNIGNLSGIDFFTGITNLNLSDNPFTDITPLNALNLVNLTVQNGKADLKLFEPTTAGQAESDWKYTLLDFYGTVNLTDALVEEQLLHIYNNHLTANGAIYKDNKYVSGVKDKEWKPYDDELKRVATNLWGVITLKAGESKTLPTTFTWKTENDLKVSYTKQNVAQTAQSYNLDKNVITLPYNTAPSVDVTALLTVRVSYTEPVSGKTYNVTVNKFIYLQTDTDLKVELPDGSTEALNVAVTDSTARRLILQSTGEKAKANGNVISREMLGSIKSMTFVCDSEEGLAGLKIFEGLNLENLSVLYGSEKTGQATPLFAPIGAVADTLKTLTIQRTFADLTQLPILPNLTTLTLKNCPKIVMTGSGDNAVGVFDQTVSEPKFPALTELNLNSNYITSASPLIGLRKVTKLTFYDNPSSKSALTDAVIAEIFENLTEEQKAEFAYYIVTSDILWQPNSSVANTITEAGAKFADGTTVNPEIHGVNYVEANDTVTLPSSYTVNGATYSVEWKTDFTDTVTIGNGTAAFRNPHDAKAYVKITASFPILTKTIDYYFVVSGNVAAGDRGDYVNFDLFEEVDNNGKTVVSDPYFTYYCYELLNAADSANTTGLYLKSVAEGIAEIAFSNTLTTRNYSVKSLKGIENFTGLSVLKINYNTVTDLSPIENLTSLRVLEVMGNEISSLYLDDGVTSVFHKLTALEDLKIAYNNNIEDYKPVVYASVNGNSKTLRTGLSQLKTLFLVDILSSASTWNSESVNASDWVLTLWEWFGAVSEADGSFRGVTLYTVVSHYTQTIQNSDALKRLKGSCAILLGGDIPDVYIVTKDANNNYIVPNIIKSVSPANDYLYTVDYTAVTAAGGDFISVGADSITLQNVDKIGIGGKMILRATVYVNATDLKVYKEIELDTSILNDNEQLTGLPLIEVTGEEKTVYLNFGKGLADSDFIATLDGTFRISAEKLIPDYAFSRYLYTAADKNADKILSVSERSSLTSVRLEREGVRDLTGFELFPNVSNLHLWDNRVERISDFPALPYASQSDLRFIAQDDYLKDVSGLLTLKDGARYRVVSFSLNSCGAFGQWNADVLSKLPLTDLSLTATGITDYSFLTEGLNQTLKTLSIGIFDGRNDHNYPIFEDYYGYRETLTRVLFETGGAIGGDGENKGLILTGDNKSTIAGFDASETYLYPYLNAVKNVKKDGVAVALDQTFQAFGKTYQVRYALPSGSKLTLNGYNLTVPKNYSGSSFTLIVQSGVKNADGTTTWTFTQETPFYFGASAEENASELLTDGYVYDASAVNNLRKLSDFVPDTGLRTVLLAIFDTNSDGTITLQELKSKGSSNISLTVPSTGDLSFISPVPISSFEGIGFFSDYFTKQLIIFGANTTDLSPLSELVNVTYLGFNATNYIYMGNDANNHSNITDWSFLSGMKKLTTINLVHTNSLGTNLEAIVDSLSLTVFTSYNEASLFYYSTVSNAIAYGQSANNISDYLSPNASNKTGNLFYGTRKDQKRASIILNSLAIEDLLKDGSRIFLKDVAGGSGFALPSAISFEGTDYAVEYIPLSTNLVFDAATNTMTAKYVKNYTHAKFVARIYMDGALYERMLEFDITA